MDAGFIFAAYVLDSRRRIAGVSVIAASNTRELSDADDVETITVKDVLSVIEDAAHEILRENRDTSTVHEATTEAAKS